MSVSKIVKQVWEQQEKDCPPIKKKKVVKRKPRQIINKPRHYIEIDDDLWKSIGRVETGTKIGLRGPSYSGKSSVLIKLIKPLLPLMKVDYNNHEEKGGDAGTVKRKLLQTGITEDETNLTFYKAFLESDEFETFSDILRKKGSAGFAILDSMQHAGMTKRFYDKFVYEFSDRRKKILAFISHNKMDDLVLHVWHDIDVKLHVIGYVCSVESRLEDATNKPIIIWEEKARKYWGQKYRQVINGTYWPGRKK